MEGFYSYTDSTMSRIEDYYRLTIEQGLAGFACFEILRCDDGKPEDFRFIEVNRAFERLTGLKADYLAGKTWLQINPGYSAPHPTWMSCIDRLLEMPGSEEFDQFFPKLEKWFRIQVIGSGGNLFTATFHDVSNEHQLAGIAEEVNRYSSINVDYKNILNKLRLISGADYALLTKLNIEGKEVTTLAADGFPVEEESATDYPDLSFVGKKRTLDPVRKVHSQNKTTFFPDLLGMEGGALPVAVLTYLSTRPGIGGVALVRTEAVNGTIGDFTLVFKKGQRLQNRELVESFADMVGMMMSRIDAEELLRQTHDNYDAFFNTIDSFLFVLDEQARIIHTNSVVVERLGYTSDELSGLSVLEIHPAERREEAARIVGQMLAGISASCPVPLLTKNGEQIPVETRVSNGIWNGKPVIFGVTKDISKIKFSEEKFSKVFYLNPSICGLSDLITGKYVEVNDVFYSLLGFDKEEVIGRTAHELGILTTEAIEEVLSNADENGSVHNIRADLKTKTGEILHVLLSAENIQVQDQVLRYTVVNDITERIRHETELKLAKEKAEESDKFKSAFLANMSHEIRTPMNGILGFAELLKESGLDPFQQSKYLSIIDKSGHRLLAIINDIIDLSKLQAGQAEVNRSLIDINEMLDFIVEFFKPEAYEKGLELTCLQALPANDAHVWTDKEKLYAVLINLTKNAIKFTHEGCISLQCLREGVMLHFIVRDTGVGIPEGQRQMIFERFRRSTTLHAGKYEGNGLGLSICKGYIEILGGTIRVESEEGCGSAFHVSIPVLLSVN